MSPPPISTIVLPTPYAIGPVNCHLLPGEPLTLIDPGPNSIDARTALADGLAAHGLRFEDVELVLLTHQHTDHEGLAGEIRAASGCAVAAHELLVPFLADVPAALAREDAYQAEMMRLHGVPADIVETLLEVSRGFHRFGASVEVDRPLREGDVLEAGGRALRVEFRPGHSPSCTVFVDEEERLAFVGDHLLAHVSPNPIAHRPLREDADPRRRPPTLPTYLDSLRRTAELDVDIVHAGHREAIRDHRALVAERLERQQQRTATVLDWLGDPPRTAHSVAQAMWEDVATRQAYLTLSEVLGALDVLVADGMAVEVEVEAGDGLRYARV